MYINQRDAEILVNNLYFFVNRLYMFRTIISTSSGETFNKLYSAIGIFVPVRLAAARCSYDVRKTMRRSLLPATRVTCPELSKNNNN
jgi:hypothetical protein